MRSNIIFISWVLMFAGMACSMPKSEPAKKSDSKEAAAKTQEKLAPPTVAQLHYRLPLHQEKLKKALEPVGGPSVPLVWPHVESLQAFSMWIFELPKAAPGQPNPPRFAACLRGRVTEWLYAGMLMRPDNTPVRFEKDTVIPVKGPEGAHPTYYLVDKGQHACLASTEQLAKDAMEWNPPAMAPEAVAVVRFDLPRLAAMADSPDVAPMLAALRTAAALARISPEEIEKIVGGLQFLDFDMELDAQLMWKNRMQLAWKEAPGFLQEPQPNPVPVHRQILMGLHVDLNRGHFLGMDLWPLIAAQNPPPEFAGKLEAFIHALNGVDFQMAQAEGGRVAARIIVNAPGQTAFLLETTQKFMEEAQKNEKISLKAVGENTWELVPTALADADVRAFLNRYAEGRLRIACHSRKNLFSWTLGPWNESAGDPPPPANVRASFAMLPFFNVFLPFMEERANAPAPRFVPYPSVEQDLWHASLVLQPARKSLTAQMDIPLGAWLNAMQKYPEILKRLPKNDAKNQTPAPQKPASDL